MFASCGNCTWIEVEDPSINTWGTSSVGAAGSIPTGGKLFAEIYLPFTMKQYKNDNTANFVYYGKTSMGSLNFCPCITWFLDLHHLVGINRA